MRGTRLGRGHHRRIAFRDRQVALTTVISELDSSYEDATYLRVLSLLGLGGTGKSRLLDEINDRTATLTRMLGSYE